MSTFRAETDSSESFDPEPARLDPLRTVFVQLKDYPELIPVLTQVVDEAITSSHLDRERDAGLVEHIERAAAAATLTTYERLAVSALRVSDAADEARRARADSVAASAEVIAGRVTDAAAEVHNIEAASAADVVQVAANAASEMAESIGLDDETAASAAAALVVRAVSDAAAVTASARADAIQPGPGCRCRGHRCRRRSGVNRERGRARGDHRRIRPPPGGLANLLRGRHRRCPSRTHRPIGCRPAPTDPSAIGHPLAVR